MNYPFRPVRLGGIPLVTLALAGCPQPQHDEIESRLAELELAREVLETEVAVLRADLDGTRERLAAAEADIDVQTIRVNTLDDDVAASIVLAAEVDALATDLEAELMGTSDPYEGSRLDDLEDWATESASDAAALAADVDRLEDVVIGLGSDAGLQEQINVHGARLDQLEAADFVVGQELAQALAPLTARLDDLEAVVEQIPRPGDCGDTDVLVYDADTGWFVCAPANSVGRVLNVTTHLNGTTRDFGYQGNSAEIDRFAVRKKSPTSILLVQGTLSAIPGDGMAWRWRYGNHPEVTAQLTWAMASPITTTAVIAGANQVGTQDLVLRAYTAIGPMRPLFMYNPDNRPDGSILPSQSVFVVWEIEP